MAAAAGAVVFGVVEGDTGSFCQPGWEAIVLCE